MEAAEEDEKEENEKGSSSSSSSCSTSFSSSSSSAKENVSLDECLAENGFCAVRDDDGHVKSVVHDGEKYYVIRSIEEAEGVYSLIKAGEFEGGASTSS